MKMDSQFIINVLGGLLIGLFGWVSRQLWDAVQKMKEDIKRIEVALPTSYVQKNEFVEAMKEIKGMLEKIFDKLDAKADK